MSQKRMEAMVRDTYVSADPYESSCNRWSSISRYINNKSGLELLKIRVLILVYKFHKMRGWNFDLLVPTCDCYLEH